MLHYNLEDSGIFNNVLASAILAIGLVVASTNIDIDTIIKIDGKSVNVNQEVENERG